MNILVTGGAGFLGSVIINKLINNHSIIIYDDLSQGFKELINPEAKFYKGSILNTTALTKVFRENKIDIVIHLAARSIASESVRKPQLYNRINFIGTEKVLKIMKKFNCDKLLFSSTAAVFGQIKESIVITEDTPKFPCNPYGETKLKAERTIIDNASWLNYCILRFFNVAGASDNHKYGLMKEVPMLLIPTINQMIGRGLTPTIFGNQYDTPDGTCIRDYIHVEDVANAVEKAVNFLSQKQSSIFNIASNKGYSVLEVIKEICKVNNVKLNYDVKPNRPGDPSKLLSSYAKAKQTLH